MSGTNCIYISNINLTPAPYIFCYGGIKLGPKGENMSSKDLYVLNTITNEWKLIFSNKYPTDRSDLCWVRLDRSAILYGGASLPAEILYDDMWRFNYDEFDFSQDNKKEYNKDYWEELSQSGDRPGKLKAYAMEYYEGCLYLFGGLDSHKINKSDLYKFDIIQESWELIKTKGKPPAGRCYHHMSLLNKNNLVIIGGIKGYLPNVDKYYDDLFLYNVPESIWVEPIIGGIQPSPRIFSSLSCNYNQDKMEVLILGGHINESEGKNLKIFVLLQNSIFILI
jgi:N-acetylneuraminic acid mutarotase